MKYQLPKNFNKTYGALVLFAILIAVFYGNTLQNGFVADDTKQIPENKYIRSLEYIPKAFTSCIWESANKGCYGRSFYYRPLHFLSAMFTYQISSQAWAFHLANLAYTFAIAALIFLLAKKLTRNYTASLLAGILFISHPINTEVINFASAAPDLLYGIFTLLGTFLYIQYREKKSWRSLLGVYIAYVLGILSKEPAILVPMVYVLLDVLVFRIPIRQLVRFDELRRYLVFPFIVLLYLLARNAVLGVGPQLGNFTVGERIHTLITLFSEYIDKLFFPYPLALYHSFEKSSNFFSASLLIAFVVAVLFAAAFWYLFQKKQWLYVFGFTWFAVFLSPVLILLGGVGENVLSERYMFVPTFGFALIAGTVFAYAFRSPKIPKAVTAGILVLLMAVSWVVIVQRNHEWKDNISLFTKTLEQNPDSHIVRRELGEIYFLKGDLEAAKAEYEYLVANAPDWRDITMAYKGLGDYWRAQGDSEQALEYYVKSAQTGNSPRDYVPHNAAGILYMEKQNYLQAFSYFCRSLQLFPTEVAQNNFDAALSFIDEKYIQQGTLHENIVAEFEESSIQHIVYLGRQCEEDTCQFAFRFRAQNFEVLPPFLITGVNTDTGSAIEIQDRFYDAEQNTIILQTSGKHEDEVLSFVFPTCGQQYYEASSETTNSQ